MKYYSVHFNRPDFLRIQRELLGEKLVVINNHCNIEIENECKLLNIEYYNLQNNHIHDPSKSHGYALDFLKNNVLDYTDDYCIIDHDLFPYKEISLDVYDVITTFSTHGTYPYMWPGFIAANKKVRLDSISFLPGLIPNGDTGCDTYKLLNDPNLKILNCEQVYIGNKTHEYVQSSPIITRIGDYCLHYLNGSDWLKTDFSIIEEKNKFLLELLNKEKCKN